MSDIVERLRSNQPLVICPYDSKSPEYWTTPDDTPCKFCGGLPDGPDKCTGADTRIMGQAADEITRLRTLLSQSDQREKGVRREGWAFAEGDIVRKKSGSWWEGRVVGTYSTEQTPRGYAVQLGKPNGPVQIYPESALESALQSEER